MSKSEMMTELAHERGWLIKEIKLVNGGPEFEVVHKAPTYEQAIVHMYREAKSIVEQGEKLKADMIRAHMYMCETRKHVDRCRLGVLQYPKGTHYYNSWNGPLQIALKRFVELLDRVWEAQEKYNAWAKLYGDIPARLKQQSKEN